MEKKTSLSLPAFAFIEDAKPNEELQGRNVILHVRSMSIIEMFDVDDLLKVKDGVLRHDFDYIDQWGVVEHFAALLHLSTTLDPVADQAQLIQEVVRPACEWYTDYLEWEDHNIIDDNKNMRNHE